MPESNRPDLMQQVHPPIPLSLTDPVERVMDVTLTLSLGRMHGRPKDVAFLVELARAHLAKVMPRTTVSTLAVEMDEADGNFNLLLSGYELSSIEGQL